MLHNLRIQKYRLFEDFEISSLAKVNLIVGTNNSGKSSLLEAIHLLTSDDVRSSLIHLLHERGEYIPRIINRYKTDTRGGYQVSHIFNGHSLEYGQAIIISSKNDQKISLKISLHEEDTTQLSLFDEDGSEIGELEHRLVFEHSKFTSPKKKESSLLLDVDGLIPDHRMYTRNTPIPSEISKLITTNHLGYDELAVLWDGITLTEKEDKIVDALQILEPKVKRLSFTSRQTSNSGVLLKLDDKDEPIPLGSMGDGMRRILAIIASLVNVGSGTLLVDEIDTGLYYATLKDMWRLIFQTASKQDVQVFATTHSWDCVKAFQEALVEFENPDFGRLIRIERIDEQIGEVPYSVDELSIAVEQDIEVR